MRTPGHDSKYYCVTRAPASGCATYVSAVAFSATGALLFTCVVDTQLNMSGRIFLYDTNDRPRRRELDLYGLGSGIRKTEFSPDGSLLAVVGSNSNVALYDVATATRRLVPRMRAPIMRRNDRDL